MIGRLIGRHGISTVLKAIADNCGDRAERIRSRSARLSESRTDVDRWMKAQCFVAEAAENCRASVYRALKAS